MTTPPTDAPAARAGAPTDAGLRRGVMSGPELAA